LPFNLTGQLAVSVPCGWTEAGLPIGLQIVISRVTAGIDAQALWTARRPALRGAGHPLCNSASHE
jgi:Asp-tRNA(Asn)/Glu-tRNA(Gln) amidotransferase A subunit family amidase